MRPMKVQRLMIATLILLLSLLGSQPLDATADTLTSREATEPGVLSGAYVHVSFYATGDGQCEGPNYQWAIEHTWTLPIRFDNDLRVGGCRLGFGIEDPTSSLAGLNLSIAWYVTPNGNGGQCWDQGTYSIPMNLAGGRPNALIGIDTDERSGWCNLTFVVEGRNDIALDIQYWADGNAGQCINSLPQGGYFTARQYQPVTIGIDADGRVGGCNLALRLRRI